VYRSSFKYFRQTRQCLEADRVEFTDEDTALHYNALVISVLLNGSEIWTLLKADERQLEAFQMNCQRRILGIHWFHFVTNASVTSQTGEEGLAIRICWRRLHFWSRVATTGSDTSPLRLAVDTRAGGKLDIRPEW